MTVTRTNIYSANLKDGRWPEKAHWFRTYLGIGIAQGQSGMDLRLPPLWVGPLPPPFITNLVQYTHPFHSALGVLYGASRAATPGRGGCGVCWPGFLKLVLRPLYLPQLP